MIGVIGGTGLSSLDRGDEVGERLTPYGEHHHIPPHCVNYRANIWALKQLGVGKLLAVNAVGGISAEMPARSIVIPDQIVDYSYGRAHTFYDGETDQLEHVDFSFPYDAALRLRVVEAASANSIAVIDGATVGVTQGPRLETAAEINRLDSDGCDLVGMTAMPEAALARELGVDYASICLVVNPAAGRGHSLITMEQIRQVVDDGAIQVKRLLQATIAQL